MNKNQNTNLTYLECWSNQLTYLDISQNIHLNVLNIEGIVLFRSSNNQFDISSLVEGLYILQIETNNGEVFH